MSQPFDLQHTVRVIRRRLFLLLMQAFVAVVLLTIVLLLALVGSVVNRAVQGTLGFDPIQTQILRSYYLGHGSWEGIAAVLDAESGTISLEWGNATLLDADGRILIDEGQAATARIGQLYPAQPEDIRLPVQIEGQTVGTMVVHPRTFAPAAVLLGVLPLVIFIAFFTGLLTLLIGFSLVQRVVNPLADTIAAAQAVTAGDLSARVAVRGPGDLRGLTDSFNRMAGALERSDRERRELLADVAHELRTPLTILRGRLEGVVDGVYPADAAHIAPALEETYLLERLVEDLRTLTLAEARQLHFDLQPVDLGELARRAVGLFEAEAGENGVALALEVESGLPAVGADPQRVGQVIGNLISNALRYVPKNGRITLTVRRAAGGVELTVSDTGPGVPEADLPHLFDRFWRADKSRARAAGGAGLGLAIARQLIEAQGGSISAANLPAGGLRVAVVLK